MNDSDDDAPSAPDRVFACDACGHEEPAPATAVEDDTDECPECGGLLYVRDA